WIINGQKTYITNGTRADFVTMLVKTNPDAGANGCSFFLVPTKEAGFQVARKLDKVGNRSSDTAELFLEDVRIPHRYLVGHEGMGFMYLMQSFQSERLIGAVSALAGAFRVLEFSEAYGRDRVAFGKPIIKRELWRHRFVDMHIKAESARAFVYKCVDHYNDDKYVKKGEVSMETVRLVSMAKVLVGDVVDEIMDTCLQFHGGAGYIEEYPIARAWRDARLFRIGGGTSETMKYYIAKLMGF
ncbi:MAG: acyl-CoA dehydrogenase family protein, partial [Myxococcota bacterium]